MTIQLRGERLGDEDAIDVVNCLAFEEMDEANLVRLFRTYYPLFDRRYSITAWDGADLVGHVLFSPARIRLMGRTVRALMLGPISVMPERQRTGIGGKMIRYGHELGRREEFALSVLYGHPSYYPRHGYQACFGLAKVTIDTDKLPPASRTLRRLPVQPSDLPWLTERYAAEWDEVDFSPLWGPSLGEYTMPCLNAFMWWTEEGTRAGYTVAKPGRNMCKMLLADDPGLAREILSTLRPAEISHHPSGWLARHALDPEWATATGEAIQAAMACELEPGVLRPYQDAIAAGQRLPGFALGPLPFLAG
jgi:putative acetyltransferase